MKIMMDRIKTDIDFFFEEYDEKETIANIKVYKERLLEEIRETIADRLGEVLSV